MFLVGASQSFFPGLQQALGLRPARGRDSALQRDPARRGRRPGATLLAPEPSYSAHTIFLFFVFAMLFYRRAIFRALLPLRSRRHRRDERVQPMGTVAFIFNGHPRRLLLLCLLRGKMRRAACLLPRSSCLACLPAARLDAVQVHGGRRRFASALSSGGIDAFTSQFASIRAVSVNVAYSSLLEGNILGHGLGS